MVNNSYKAFYFIQQDFSIVQGHFDFSLLPPPQCDIEFSCKLENSDGSSIGRITATSQMAVSSVYLTNVIKTNKLVAKLNYIGSGASDTVLTIELPQDYRTSLSQANIEFDYVRVSKDANEIGNDTKDAKNIVMSSPAIESEPPVSYFTSFEESGIWYFLHYIDWLDYSSLDFFTPPKQMEKHASSGKYCCVLYENDPFGTSEFWSKELPIPQNTIEASLTFSTYFLMDGAFLIVTLKIDGNQVEQRFVEPHLSNTFSTSLVSCEIPKGAKKFSFHIKMGRLGNIPLYNDCYLDDLSLNFVAQKVLAIDYGAVMNGTNTAIAAPSNTAYNVGQGDFTVEALVKPTGAGTLISRKSTQGGSGNGGFLLVLKPDGKFKLATDNGFGFYEINTVTTQVFDGNWHHVAGVRKNNALTVYFDGNPIDASVRKNISPPINTDNSMALVIGATDQNQEQYNHLRGIINETRYWNIARTPEEIKEFMFMSVTGNEPNLKGYWPLTDKNVKDMTTLHNDGQIRGPVTFDGPADDLLMVCVAKNSVAGYSYIGDHTFVYVVDPKSSAPYPNNVVCWFNCAGGHGDESGHSVPISLNILNVRASLYDLVKMSIDTPVTTPFKKEYGGSGFFGTETCGIDPSGKVSKSGWCHQITNRLLYASSWPHRIVTLGDCAGHLLPTGYWLSVFLTGVYGSSWNYIRRWWLGDELNFSQWCEKRGFPAPPSNVEALITEYLKVTSDVKKIDKWLNYTFDFMNKQGPDKTPEENQVNTDEMKRLLKQTLNDEEYKKLEL